MHESPDYFRLKVSVFNDDKRTDLIGETWVDLNNLIVPGGGQSDNWHPLQFRGKYAGEIRIEMTYYDTRPKDDAVVERKKEVVQKVQPKASISSINGSGSSSSLSGPRKLKEVKRRPVHSDINGPSPARPSTADKAQPFPGQAQPPPSRHSYAAPPSGSDYVRHHKEMPYEVHNQAPAPVHPRTYETPDDVPREWEPMAVPAHSQVVTPKRHRQDPQYFYPQTSVETYDSRSQQTRQQPEYENPLLDYRSRQETLPNRQDHHHHNAVDIHQASPYNTPPRQNNYPVVTSGETAYAQVSKYSPRSSGHAYERSSSELVRPYPVSDSHYRPHSNSQVNSNSPLQNSASNEDCHADYASMQPSVEDGEEEEEEGPPPPPPVHRSGMVQTTQQMVPSQLPPAYKAYSPKYSSSAPTSSDMKMPVARSPRLRPDSRLDDLPPYTNAPPVPPSLIAGYDPAIAEAETDRAVYEHQVIRRRSGLLAEQPPVSQPPVSQHQLVTQPAQPMPYDAPVYPLRTSPRPVVENQVVTRRQPASRDIRTVPPRKSVSPQPPPPGERGLTGIPFSPDSYNALNPNVARSAVIRDPAPPYETPKQAMDAAIRSENAPSRDVGPIIGDDGREIDPSDHLPTDTWAPEPERKNRKPEVVIRFKHAPPKTSPQPPPPRDSGPPRALIPAVSTGRRRPQSYVRFSDSPLERTPPRGREGYGSYRHNRGLSAPTTVDTTPRIYTRNSVSPSGGSPSSLYAQTNPGPPIPAKVPVAAPINEGHPVMAVNQSMNALSRELRTIDIGCSTGRAVRKYVPRTVATGYAM